MTVYMEVTRDEFELPVAVADSWEELAVMRKISISSIYSIMSHCKMHGWKCRYIKVEIEDNEE